MKRTLVITAVLALTLTAGCKKKQRYSPSCKSAVTLTAPWKDLGLPTGDGRVCESSEQRTQIQYLSGDRPAWEAKYDEALVAAGFTKDRCTDQSCTYKKDDQKATVQVIQSERWVSVIVRK